MTQRPSPAELERRLATLVANLPGMVYRFALDENLSAEYISDGCTALTGYPPSAFLRGEQHVYRLVVPEDAAKLRATVETAVANRHGYEVTYRIRTASGATKWLWGHGCGIYDAGGIPTAVEGVTLDVTRQKQAEEELRFRNQLLSTVQETSTDGILVVGNDGRIMCHNRRFARIAGVPPDVLAAGRLEAVLAVAAGSVLDPQGFLARIRALRASPTLASSDEIARIDGRTVESYSAPALADDGTPYGRVVFLRDITTRKLAELALRKSEQRFRGTFEHAGVGIAMADEQGRCFKVNAAFRKMIGYSDDELARMTFAEFTHPDDVAAAMNLFHEMMSGARDKCSFETRYIAKGGREIRVALNVSIVRPERGQPPYTICVVEDVTERRRLEEQLRQAQKMEAIGNLAGGIAHDFNNLLTVILGYAEMLREQVPDDAPTRADIEQVVQAGRRAEALTHQLLAFSRRSPVRLESLDLNALVVNLEKMLRPLIGEDVRLHVAQSPGLGRIRADAGQIEQVVVNLVVNARDAMTDGGAITIAMHEVVVTEALARAHAGATSGLHIVLTVSDNGSGMPPEVLSKVFDPFFTTKAAGRGTGLGLSTVYGIVRAAGGFVDVSSVIDRGTTFAAYFPREDVAIETPAAPSAPPASDAVGQEIVLLVEDDDAIRVMASRVLRRAGYVVIAANSAEEAMAAAAAERRRIDLLLTDLVMPGLNGLVLSESLRELRPQLATLITSGYPNHIILSEQVAPNFIAKPYTPEVLLRGVRRVLDAAASR